MTKGLHRSLQRGAFAGTQVHRKVVKVKDKILTVDGATGVGFGSVVIDDFPEGNILFLGALAYMQFTGPTSGDLSDVWEGDYSVGTTPADDATLTDDDIDIITSTPILAATAEASPRTLAVDTTGGVAGQWFLNTDNSLEVNLNLLIDDAHISADGIDMTVNGELYIAYLVLGD